MNIFDKEEPELPQDLLDRGFKLIVRGPGQMFAVSRNRGGTVTSDNLEAVITNARAIAAYIEWRERREHDRSELSRGPAGVHQASQQGH